MDRRIRKFVLIGGAILLLLFTFFPFYWMFITSLKTQAEAILFPPTLWPKEITFDAYKLVFTKLNIGMSVLVTLGMIAVIVSGEVVTSTLAAYAFSWIDFKGREILFSILLVLASIPMPVFILQLFIVVQKLGLVDTFAGLVVPWLANIYSIFLLRQAFKSIPRELRDAIYMDGGNDLTFLLKVAIPIARPVLITVVVFSAVYTWNSFLWPLLVVSDKNLRPIQLAVAYFSQGEVSNYPALMAASFLSALPALLVFAIFQRQITEVYARGGMKD
ncbi:MAG: carbohydrate ABC transporter permease [Thermotogae bacterium]|nr:carbohydrate ABC transporter permease [Thermotogota bacterium]